MSRLLVVIIPSLSDARREQIRSAAEGKGYRAVFADSPDAARNELAEAEIVFTQDSAACRLAPKMKWICTPSAGVNQFLAPDCFASPDAVLTNSSGAYGVTIAEHIIMLILEHQRRKPEYDAIVRRREWVRNLPIRSIKDSRITLLGTGDIGQEAAVRLRAAGGCCSGSVP